MIARMKYARRTRAAVHLGAALLLWAVSAGGQTLNLSNGVVRFTALTNTTVSLNGRCELWVTSTSAPLSGCTIHLNSTDAFFVASGIAPSVAVSTYLSQVRVGGAAAVADVNCRVVEYGTGAAVIPHPSGFRPLTIFSGPHFTGLSASCLPYVYYKSQLGALYANIGSFKLKRGYMATFAQNESGSGASRCCVAADGDMEVSVVPAAFDHGIRFVYVAPWRWTSKKGIAGNIESGLNVQWKYNWNIDQNSTRDLEYVPIRQLQYWPGLGQNWQSRGANHLLGYNEPDQSGQANMSVATAVSSWPDLLGTGLRLGSPATSDGGWNWWMYPFLAEADAASLRVDFVAVHYYRCRSPVSDAAGAASQMYDALKGIYDQTQRPLWVTEWNNGASWTGCGDPTYAQQRDVVAAIINMLDTTPFVERYSIYNWVEDVRRVKWDDGGLTSAGVAYRDKSSPIGYVQALRSNGTRSFAQLRFEDNTLDTAGYGNNGLAAGAPAFADGHTGRAIVFDGANTYVTLPANIALGSAFTFAAWIYWNGGSPWQRIFDFGNSTTEHLFLTPRSGGNTLRFKIKDGDSEQILETAQLPSGRWTHVAVTLSGSTAKLYTNGLPAATTAGLSLSPGSFDPRVNRLGKSQFYGDPLFSGQMDEVLITDYALSAAQIAGLPGNLPPQFASNILTRPEALAGAAYSGTLAGEAADPDPGDTLGFHKVTGPDWLTIASDGTLGGTPAFNDGGTNEFTVRVSDPMSASGFAVLRILVPGVFTHGVWIADADGSWSETNRWRDGLPAYGIGYTADFSAIDLSGNRTVTLDRPVVIGALKFGDTGAPYGEWTLASTNSRVLTLDAGDRPILDVANTATIAASLAGTNGFTKTGSGTLVLNADNSLSGTIYTENSQSNGGALRVAHPQALAEVAALSIQNNNAGSFVLQLDGSAAGIAVPADITLAGRSANVPAIENLAGTNTLSGDLAITVGGTNYWIQSDLGRLTLAGDVYSDASGTRRFTFQGGGDITVTGAIANGSAGQVNLAKRGAGTLTLAGANTYSGTTAADGGVVLVNGSLDTGAVTIAAGATLGGSGTIGGTVSIENGATWSPGAPVGTVTVSHLVLHDASTLTYELGTARDRAVVTGALTLDGVLNIADAGGFTNASYVLFTYSTLTDNGLTLGAVPNPAFGYALVTGNNQVRLDVTCTNCPTDPAGITYVDATSGAGGNTTLADGSAFTPPANTAATNSWVQRSPLGSSGNIFEAGGLYASRNAPELRTRISGLTPGGRYAVYAFLWDPPSTSEDWNIRAGFSPNPSANALFSAADATGQLGAAAAGLAQDLVYRSPPMLFGEGNRVMLAALVGTNTADGSGQIDVYLDDKPTTNNVNARTWLDGVGYGALPPPAPASLAATPGDARVSLSWAAASGAASYNVKRALDYGGPYATIASGLAGLEYTNAGLSNGTTYFYVVSASSSGGESPVSAVADATPFSAWQVWQMLHFGCWACPEADPCADADGDGYANLMEYATGGDPALADQAAQLAGVMTNDALALTFTRDTNAVGATLTVEGAYGFADASPWFAMAVNSNGAWAGAAAVTEAGATNPVAVTVQDVVPAATSRLLRLRVARP